MNLTKLQAEVSAAQTKRFDLELKIALEEQPSAVIAAARAQGMIVPSIIHDIPAVSIAPANSTLANSKSKDNPKKQTSSSGSSNGSVANRGSGHP